MMTIKDSLTPLLTRWHSWNWNKYTKCWYVVIIIPKRSKSTNEYRYFPWTSLGRPGCNLGSLIFSRLRIYLIPTKIMQMSESAAKKRERAREKKKKRAGYTGEQHEDVKKKKIYTRRRIQVVYWTPSRSASWTSGQWRNSISLAPSSWRLLFDNLFYLCVLIYLYISIHVLHIQSKSW